MRASEYPRSGQKEKDRGSGKTGSCPTAHEQSRIFPFFDAFPSDDVGRKTKYRYLWKMYMNRSTEHLSGQPRSRLVMKALLIVGFLGIAERVIGLSLYSSSLYLISIIPAAWFGGTTIGIIMCIASTLAGLSVHITLDGLDLSSSTLIHHFVVRLGIYLTIHSVLSVLKDSMEHEKEFARTDFLTGVGNRRSFTEDARKEIDRAQRYGYPFTVIYIDVDNLKAINDRSGHDAGDMLLKSLAQAIRRKLRMTDLVARLGGDEFGILLPEADADVAELVIRRLQNIGKSLMQNQETPMPFSMGVVTFLDPPSSVDEMLSTSDKLMYTAKKNGKHTICREIYSKHEQIYETNQSTNSNGRPSLAQKNYAHHPLMHDQERNSAKRQAYPVT